jgi:hypothetical protein
MERSVSPIVKMYELILSGMVSNHDDDGVIAVIRSELSLRDIISKISQDDRQSGRNFSSTGKNAVYLNSLLDSAVRCGICDARVLPRVATVDHIVRREDGGTGDITNGQPVHPFCNTGFKESKVAVVRRGAT